MAEIDLPEADLGPGKSNVRNHNERLLLSLIQRLGPTPGSDLARCTGLSAQTVSVILRSLESDGLVVRGQPQRGRVGKPSVPINLDPTGAFSIGMKIGRRSADLAVMDLSGAILRQLHTRYRYPLPSDVFRFLEDGLKKLTVALPSASAQRICGIGIAAPFDIWKWDEILSAPAEKFSAWRSVDFKKAIGGFSDLPVSVINDGTAACYAESVFGQGPEHIDYAYFFVGSFIGGGIVLNSAVYEGRHGNAGALGSLRSIDAAGKPAQLMDVASIHLLESEITRAGRDPALLWDGSEDWSTFSDQLDPWIEKAGREIAVASLSACAVIDFEAVIIDGAFPSAVRAELVRSVRNHAQELDTRGLVQPQILEGGVGVNARVLGAAYGPISSRYFLANSPLAKIVPSDRT